MSKTLHTCEYDCDIPAPRSCVYHYRANERDPGHHGGKRPNGEPFATPDRCRLCRNWLHHADRVGKDKYELSRKFGEYWIIRALKNFKDVKVGDFGGFVQSSRNLSQKGTCWICEDARASEDSVVSGNAVLGTGSRAFGHARIGGDAVIMKDSVIGGYARVDEQAKIFNADVGERAWVHGHAMASGNQTAPGTRLDPESEGVGIFGHAEVSGHAQILGDAKVYGPAKVRDYAMIGGESRLCRSWGTVVSSPMISSLTARWTRCFRDRTGSKSSS